MEQLSGTFEKIRGGFRKEWKTYPESIKEKNLEQIAVAFTYNTNAIEGSKITLPETRELIERGIAPNKPMRDIRETEAHARVFLEMLKLKGGLSAGLLLEWHSEIFKDTMPDIAGRFRNYLVAIAGYRAPDWQDVQKLMEGLLRFCNAGRRTNPVELAGRAHYRFEKIHPFGDGNGRIGRLVMNYILWQGGYPMLIIEYKKREAYYRALKKGEEEFLGYFIRRYLGAHKKYLKRPKHPKANA